LLKYKELKDKIKLMRIAILGNYATQFLQKPLFKKLKNIFDEVNCYHAEFNSIDFELIDENSGLFQFAPDFIVWHESTLGLRDSFYQSPVSERSGFSLAYKKRIEHYLLTIERELPNAKVLYPNHDLNYTDNVFGNFGLKVKSSWDSQKLNINYFTTELAQRHHNFYPIESQPCAQNLIVSDYAMVVNAELHFTPDYLNWLSTSMVQTIQAFSGKFKKCIVLDLDNTLWGGIIGDDGIENIQIGNLGIGKAFTRFQKWLKELQNRGIILAVCSKNEESIAKSVFQNHPEMILKLKDIAVFIANWNSKADNINHIQKILNIGFDSMVFLDDNPAEREIVRKHIPEICVPELPDDPSDYLPFLISENLFETVSFSENDEERTKQYQEEAKRQAFSSSITNMEDYLTSLQMTAKVTSFQKNNVERIAQLTQRSNQFNLRTVRYSSQDIRNIMNDKNYLTFSVQMEDKFGSYGLISLAILKIQDSKAFIETWIMSCRVLKRTVEYMLMNIVMARLKEKKITILTGEYIPTEKNKLVENLLLNLSMEKQEENKYALKTIDYKPINSYIQ
jgi:FkbH-like protein